MSMFNQFYTQSIRLHKYGGTNDYGDTVYSPPLDCTAPTIQCRIEFGYKEIIDNTGEKVTSAALVFTSKKLNPLDVLIADGCTYSVKTCKPIMDLWGKLDHYEAYL